MRRLIVGAALVGFVLAGAACGGQTDDTNTPGTSTPSATPSVDVSANTKEVCASAQKALTDAVAKFTAEAPGQIAAAMSGGADAKEATVQMVKKAFGDWATMLRAEGAKAADAGLKTALTDTATQLDAAAAEIKTFDDIKNLEAIMGNPALEKAGESIEKYCPTP